MKLIATSIISLLLTLSAFASTTIWDPIYYGLFQTDANGNGFGLTNLNSVQASNFIGNGSGLTNISATNISGIVQNLSFLTNSTEQVYNVNSFGAFGASIQFSNASISSNSASLVIGSSSFTSGSVGQTIDVRRAGLGGTNDLVTTISVFTDANHVTLASVASNTVSSSWGVFGIDETTQIQNGINIVCSNGGGTLFFPAGVYLVAGALQDTGAYISHHNSQLFLPPLANPPGFVCPTLTLAGVNTLGYVDGRNIYQPIVTGQQTLIWSALTGQGGSVISDQNYVNAWFTNTFSGVHVQFNSVGMNIKNMTWFGNSSSIILDLRGAPSAKVDNCAIACAFGLYGVPVYPANTNSIGVIMPVQLNPGMVSSGYNLITGFWTGLEIGEHFTSPHEEIISCSNAVGFDYAGGHASRIEVLDAEGCQNIIYTGGVTGATGLNPVPFTVGMITPEQGAAPIIPLSLINTPMGGLIVNIDNVESNQYTFVDAALRHVTYLGAGSPPWQDRGDFGFLTVVSNIGCDGLVARNGSGPIDGTFNGNGYNITTLNAAELIPNLGLIPANVLPTAIAFLNTNNGAALTNLNANNFTGGTIAITNNNVAGVSLVGDLTANALGWPGGTFESDGSFSGFNGFSWDATGAITANTVTWGSNPYELNADGSFSISSGFSGDNAGNITASSFTGTGSGLTGVPASALPLALRLINTNNGVALTNLSASGSPGLQASSVVLSNLSGLANATGVLTNNGSGTLSWVAVGGGGGSSGVATLNGNATNLSLYTANGGSVANMATVTTNAPSGTNNYVNYTNYWGPFCITNVFPQSTNYTGIYGAITNIRSTATNIIGATGATSNTIGGNSVIQTASLFTWVGQQVVSQGSTLMAGNFVSGGGGASANDTGIAISHPSFPNTTLTGFGTNNSIPISGTNNFFNGVAYTNGTTRGEGTVPYLYSTGVGSGWGIQVYITNYSGPLNGANTITNVKAFGIGAGGLTGLSESGSNVLQFNLYSNTMVLVIPTAGTVTFGAVTNNQSFIDWQ